MSILADPPMYLPDHVADEYVDGYEYDVGVAHAFNDLLKTLDPYLRCFWVSPHSKTFENPGRWHIGRLHPGGNHELNAYWVIQTPDGGYCEPQQMHFDRLLQMDSAGGGAKRALEKMQKARSDRQARRLKQFEDTRRVFRELLEERLDHVFETRIAVTAGMKDRAGGKRLLGPDGKPAVLSQDKPKDTAIAEVITRKMNQPGVDYADGVVADLKARAGASRIAPSRPDQAKINQLVADARARTDAALAPGDD